MGAPGSAGSPAAGARCLLVCVGAAAGRYYRSTKTSAEKIGGPGAAAENRAQDDSKQRSGERAGKCDAGRRAHPVSRRRSLPRRAALQPALLLYRLPRAAEALR
jgi:hypothetical protein